MPRSGKIKKKSKRIWKNIYLPDPTLARLFDAAVAQTDHKNFSTWARTRLERVARHELAQSLDNPLAH